MGLCENKTLDNRHIELPYAECDNIGRKSIISIRYFAGCGDWSWRPNREDTGYTSCYTLAIALRGSLRFHYAQSTDILQEREYILLSSGMDCDLQAETVFAVVLINIPHHCLSSKLISIDDHLGAGFPKDRQMTLFLADFMDSVVELFHQHRPSRPHILAAQLVNCIAMAIGSEIRENVVDVRSSRYKLRRRITDYIEEHIRDETLTPSKVAEKCGVSISYLYALLRDGGVTLGYLLQMRRLELAYEILAGDIKKHRTVADVAYEVGFKNVSHFSRSFSQRFHRAPRDVRNAAGAVYVSP